MNFRILIVLFCMIGSSFCVGAERLDLSAFQRRFAEELEKLDQERIEALARLWEGYRAALLRVEHRYRAAGDLQALILVREELARAESDERLLPAERSAEALIAALQETLARQIAAVDARRDEQVDDLVGRARSFARNATAEVLRSGDVDGAVAWRDWETSLAGYLSPLRMLNNPPGPGGGGRLSPAIALVSARYGAGERWRDVTEAVREALDPEAGLQIPSVTNEWAGGDPASGVVKRLEAVFRIAEHPWTVSAQEGSPLRLSVDELHEQARALLVPARP